MTMPIQTNNPAAPENLAEALRRTRVLLPGIRARAAQADLDRRLSDETISELRSAGLFRASVPKLFGGSDLGFEAMAEIAAELGSACGSTGWVYGVLSGHNWMLGLFEEAAQREAFADPDSLCATVYRLDSNVVPDGNGFRLTGGEGRFCSGVDFVNWVIVGSNLKREGAAPEAGFFLIPASEVVIVDDWFTAGMRGTGSKTIKIKDSWIPAHRMIRVADIRRGDTPGARFHGDPRRRLGTAFAQPFSLIGTPLGIARGAVAEFAAATGKKLSQFEPEQLAEQSSLLARLGKAAAEIDAASSVVRALGRFVDESANPAEMSGVDRARIKRDIAYAAQQCRYAVTALYEAAGGSGIYSGSTIQRMWRDVNGATSHAAFGWDAASANYGRAIAGLPPSRFNPY